MTTIYNRTNSDVVIHDLGLLVPACASVATRDPDVWHSHDLRKLFEGGTITVTHDGVIAKPEEVYVTRLELLLES